jgi:hypothetical protein
VGTWLWALLTLARIGGIDLVQLRDSPVRFRWPFHWVDHLKFSLARIGSWPDMNLAVSPSNPERRSGQADCR